jgi:hypothetical protein
MFHVCGRSYPWAKTPTQPPFSLDYARFLFRFVLHLGQMSFLGPIRSTKQIRSLISLTTLNIGAPR